MKNTFNAVYQYAVVRFMPFIEIREFANVGVVLIAPKTGKFLFKLPPKRFGRVTQFFDDLDGQLYKNAIDTFTEELDRVQRYCIEHGIRGKELADYFVEVTCHRESVMHFGNIGRMMGDTDLAELDILYQRFVVRDFVNDEYREKQMVKALRQTFKAELPVRYTEKTLKADIFEVTVPFVHKAEQGIRVIKPLAFDQRTPLRAVEHGEQWVKRMQRLINNDILLPERALFAVDRPLPDKTDFVQVYDDILDEIKQLGVQVDQFKDINNILQFAKADLLKETPPEKRH
jgi:L-rhamnose isomerase